MIHKMYYLPFKEIGLKGESKSVRFDFLDLIDIIGSYTIQDFPNIVQTQTKVPLNDLDLEVCFLVCTCRDPAHCLVFSDFVVFRGASAGHQPLGSGCGAHIQKQCVRCEGVMDV